MRCIGHTATRWRILCELYAKFIGLLLQHWLIILFAWQEEQRSLVKLAQVVSDSTCSLLEALAGSRLLCSVLQSIQSRMRSGCYMNKRKKHPNSAQLLQCGATNLALGLKLMCMRRGNFCPSTSRSTMM